MQKHKKLSARILSMALSVAMVATMLPMTVFATEGDMPLGASSVGGNDIGTIQSFDKLEDRFIPSVGKDAPSHVYGLSVALDTPATDLNLPTELTAMVARTTTAPAEDEDVADSGKPSEPAADETIPNEDNVVEGDTDTDDTVSGNQPASPSDAEEEVKAEITDGDVPLAPAQSQGEEVITTTVKSETIPVTWSSDKEYKSDENGKFIYTAEISEDYILADGVELPQIYVAVGRQARTGSDAITININNGTTGGGASLQAVVEANGAADTVTSLTITAGEVTIADWKYLKNLTALETFEIAAEVATVANIPNGAFDTPIFPTSIAEVTVPQAITIGEYAFQNCTALASVSFSKATSIGISAFYDCTKLTSVSFPEVASIGNFAFKRCTSLASVGFPIATSMGSEAFGGCIALTSVSFPEATRIANYAFYNCKALTSATFPKVANIDDNAFGDCIKFATLKLPAKPPTIGSNVFKNCAATRALAYVDADGNALTGDPLKAAKNTYKTSTADGDGTDGKWYGWTIEAPKIMVTAKISGKITTLSGATLQAALDSEKTNITELTITTGEVTTDDWYYLNSLSALTTFEIDDAVTTVANIPSPSGGTATFPPSIVSVTVPQAITLGDYAFYNCTKLTTVSFPEATTIGDIAFSKCAALTTASFPKVETIGESAFSECIKLTTVEFPEATNIGESAFYDCVALTSASFPKAETIGNWAFSGCAALASASFPKAERIGDIAFSTCTKLATLTLPATPPTVASDAFENCPATRSLAYVDADGNALTGDPLKAAKNTYKTSTADGDGTDGKWYGWTIEAPKIMVTAKISGKITTLSGATLQAALDSEKTNITELTITAGEVTAADWNYLQNLTALTTFEIASSIADDKVANIPDTTDLDGSIFPKTIVSVTVPQAITIGADAFYLCNKFTTATFPKATAIGRGAFSYSGLVTASFPEVTTIGESAFQGCRTLATVSFPKAATIGEGAFYKCAALATLKLPATPPTVGTDAFTDCPATRALSYVAADGTPLTASTTPTLATAQAAYKADSTSGAVVGDKWYGWTIVSAAPTHKPVTNITGVPTTAVAGTGLSLTGTVVPADATNKTIVWSVKSAGTTNATISGSTLSTTAAGTVTVTATITNGLTASSNYTQDFTITVNAPKTPASIAVTTAPTKTAYTTGETFNKAGMVVTATYTDNTSAAVSGYTFSPNTALTTTDTTITISYTENGTTVTTTQAITVTDAPTTHTITASAGTGGSISPAGTVTVNNGANQTFTISANSNYSIASVSVDGASQGVISTYTFSNVTGNHTISATFSYNGGGGGGGGGSSSGGGGNSTTTPPTTKPTEPVTGSSNTNATVDNKGNANVNVTEKNISDAVKAAKDAASKKGVNAGEVTAVINVTAPANSNPNMMTVNLPKTVQQQVINNKIGNLAVVIDKPDISIGMNLATIMEMNKQANADIQLSATRTDATKLSTEAKNAIGSRPAFDLKATYANGSKSVTNFGTGTVSVAIPYTLQKGEVAGGVYGVYVDGNGKVNYITNSSYDAENKVLRFATNHFSVYGISYKAPIAFTDIASHWAKTDIEFVVNRGLMSGTSNTTFAPNTAMTRGMFVTALGRLSGVDVSSYKTGKFTDVKTDAYYAPYVNWAKSKNIVNGTTATTFAPDQSITRQEMAVIMSNYAKAMGYTIPETRVAVTFADNGSIGSWAATAVKQMQMAGILNGKDGNRFDPTGTATRGEISAMLHRYVELVIDRSTAQGLDTNDSGSAMMYENGKAVKSASRTVGSATYNFNANGEATAKTNTTVAVLPVDNKKTGTYTVQKGDSFWLIAKKVGCTMTDLEQLNGKNRYDIIYAGQVLKVPQK